MAECLSVTSILNGAFSAATFRATDLPPNFHPAAVRVSGFLYALRRWLSNGRSAELAGVAQPIVRCGECGGIGCRREVFQQRVRAFAIVIGDLCRNLGPGVIEIEEQRQVQELIAHASVDGEDDPAPSAPALCWRHPSR